VSESGQTWIEASIHVSSEYALQIETLLASMDVLSITLTDPADTPVLEPGVGETPLWPDVVVTGLFSSETNIDELRSTLARAPGVAAIAGVGISILGDRDWARAWLAEFKPMKFGRDLWIVPGGQQAPDPQATIIKLDPGLAFGSGTHPTTRLCLEWIDEQNLQARSFMDYGCGSGILGIAAALKGASKVVCIDNDPQALIATNDNAARNGVESRVITAGPDRQETTTFDVIAANILAGTLLKLAPVLCSALKPGGLIALSGILKDQAEELVREYAGWLDDIEQRNLEDWVLISGKRKERAK
jgi:ribosomal protein L11 methyltransferase